MNIIIESPDFKAKQELHEFIHEKLSPFGGRNPKVIGAEVKLKLENSTSGENKICEVRLQIPGNDLFASRQNSTFEEAVRETVRALEKQMEKSFT
jgi:putative sigma-54 modulation protein